MPRKLLPVEAYIADRRKEGYSCDEILGELRRRGYAEDIVSLADKTYHLRNIIKVVSVVAVVAVIVSVVIASWVQVGSRSFLLPQQAVMGQISPEGESLNAAMACLSLPDSQQRLDCLSVRGEALQGMIQEPVDTKDPVYPVYAGAVGLLAGWKNDPSLCAKLEPTAAQMCAEATPLLRAKITDDPQACSAVTELGAKRQCVMDVLAGQSRAKVAGVEESIARVSYEAMVAMDKSPCQSLPYDFARTECESSVVIRQAVSQSDQSVCDTIKDAPYRLKCIQTVVEKLEGTS